EATKLLRVARTFDVKSQPARKRFNEIIKTYPDTQSAKDAQMLLAGDEVELRKTPKALPAPLPPVLPKLVLPMEPERVTVVYPKEPDIRVKQLTAKINTLVNAQLEANATATLRQEAFRMKEKAIFAAAAKAAQVKNAETQREIAAIESETRE